MTRSSDGKPDPAERPGERTGKCWHREPNAQTIRVETADQGKYLFPYLHLAFAHLKDGDDGGEVLSLSFASHEVKIQGSRLQPILKALEDLSVAWIRKIPSRYSALAPEGSTVVTGIEVRVPQESEAT